MASASSADLDWDAATLAAALSFVDDAFERDHSRAALGSDPGASLFPPPSLDANARLSDPPGGDLDAFWTSLDGTTLPSPTADGERIAQDIRREESSVSGLSDLSVLRDSTSGSGSGGGANSDATESVASSPTDDTTPLPKARASKKRDDRKTPRRRFNPNRARDEHREELRRLRVEAGELETQLRVLHSHRCHLQGPRRDGGLPPGMACQTAAVGQVGVVASSVWKAVADRQLQRRMAATHTNTGLRSSVLTNQATITRMAKLLRSYNAERAAQCTAIERARGISELSQYQMDPSVVRRLIAGVEKSYHEVNSVFRYSNPSVPNSPSCSAPELRIDSAGNMFSRIFGNKVLPYSVEAAGQAAWSQFAESVRPTARCFVDEIAQATNDIVVSRFATELHLDGSKMVAFGWQAKRRYVEADRVVIVWQSLTDPLEFKGQRVAGASYEEHGFYVIHRPPSVPDGFSLLQTCYRVSPRSPMQSVPQSPMALAMTEFMLNWMATSIPANHQTLEDTLFDQSLVVRK